MPCIKNFSIRGVDIERSDLIFYDRSDGAYEISRRVFSILKKPNCSVLFVSCQKDLTLGAYNALILHELKDQAIGRSALLSLDPAIKQERNEEEVETGSNSE